MPASEKLNRQIGHFLDELEGRSLNGAEEFPHERVQGALPFDPNIEIDRACGTYAVPLETLTNH